MIWRILLPGIVMLLVGVSSYAHALVLCAGANGAVYAMAACRPGTVQIDPAALGLTGQPGSQGPVGPQGPAGPQGPPGPAGGTSEAFFVRDSFTNVFADGLPGPVVVSKLLPAGSYILHAKMLVDNFNTGGDRVVQCEFNPELLDSTRQHRVPEGNEYEILTLLDFAVLTEPTMIEVTCRCDLGNIGTAVTVEAHLAAIKVDSVQFDHPE